MPKFSHTLIIFLILLFATACTANPSATTEAELQPASIQLSWIHEYSSAPFHVAVKEGFFADEGLEANLVVGGFGENGYIDPLQEVLDGTTDFGISSGPGLIEARDKGMALVGVANVMQRSPLTLFTLDETIQNPQDLVGKSILVADGGARRGLESFLNLQNIALDSVTIIPRTDFGIEPLVNGDVDAMVAWIINEGVSLQEQNLEPTFFLLSDYGVENYDFILFTTEARVNENPELVQKVVNAVHSGLDFTINNSQAAIEATLSFAPDLDEAAQLRRLEASIPLMRIDGVEEVSMNPEVWVFSYGLLLEQGLVSADLDVTTAYTLQFAEASADVER